MARDYLGDTIAVIPALAVVWLMFLWMGIDASGTARGSLGLAGILVIGMVTYLWLAIFGLPIPGLNRADDSAATRMAFGIISLFLVAALMFALRAAVLALGLLPPGRPLSWLTWVYPGS